MDLPAEVKRRVFTDRKDSLPPIKVVKKETFLFEYAMYTKDHSFIKIIRKAVAGMVVRQPAFTCCTRGTTDAGTPAWETDYSSLSVPVSPELNAQEGIVKILTDYLIQVSKVNNEVIEEVIQLTCSDQNGLLFAFFHLVELRVFNYHEELPNYEWDLPAKMRTSFNFNFVKTQFSFVQLQLCSASASTLFSFSFVQLQLQFCSASVLFSFSFTWSGTWLKVCLAGLW